MALLKRYGTALAASTILLSGLSAPAAFAADTPPSHSTLTAADLQLDNLRWMSMQTITGSLIWMLRVDSDPCVAPGGLYFLWNPDTSSRAGGFALGDDGRVSTVSSWESAIFRPNYTAHRIEVRYGDPDNPQEAEVVAGYTNEVA